jgi:uncharacterized protein involved in response to NO
MRHISIKTTPLAAQTDSSIIVKNRYPLWQLGFRPFYLLAALFAAFAVPVWVARYLGWITVLPQIDLNWHMHEMVFGMVIAVIIGFLFTAAKNWTELWTPRNEYLIVLVGLWMAGRVAMLFAPPMWAAMIDALFIPCAAWPLFRVLQKSGNKRNLFLIGLLGLLTLANLLYHAAILGRFSLAPMQLVQTAILIIVVIESVIGTRVIPMFTRNGAPGVQPIVHLRRDQITLALLVAASLAWVIDLPVNISASLAVLAASAIVFRLIAWKAHCTLSYPLLWILHLSTAWIPIGFYLLALAECNLVTISAAFHALTVGSMAGLILGMMTRTSLGHTGRKLIARRVDIAMFVLIQLGAVTRALAALTTNAVLHQYGIIIAGICWAAAFLVFVISYAPYLFRARIDGKEG